MVHRMRFLFLIFITLMVKLHANNTFNLQGKIALVTGGARGIGKQIIYELLNSGVKGVTLIDIDIGEGNEVARDFNNQFGNGRVIFLPTDITKSEQFEDAFRVTLAHWNGLDILVNNAGMFSERNWKSMVNVNVVNGDTSRNFLGYKYMSKGKSGRGGVIINISSVAGIDPFFYIPIYTATKHFIVGLGRSLGHQVYYDFNKIRLVTVCPGPTRTGTTQLTNVLSDTFAPNIAEVVFKNTTYSTQSVNNVAKGVGQVIKQGRSGSVWVVENDNAPYEIEFKDRKSMAKQSI